MNKYSQSNQDLWVLENTKHYYGTAPYYVDLGAYDGRLFSNTLRLEEMGWDGICIEANPNNFEQLAKNRKCRCLNIMISTKSGIGRISDEGSSSQTVDENGIEVICRPIKWILKYMDVPKYIDYISSDLERMDAQVWESFPFNEYSFGLATVEHCLYEGNNNFKERIMKVMLENGYVLAKENVESDGNAFEDWYKNKNLCL